MKANLRSWLRYATRACKQAMAWPPESGLSFVLSLLLAAVLLPGNAPPASASDNYDNSPAVVAAFSAATGDTIAALRARIPLGDEFPDTCGYRIYRLSPTGDTHPFHNEHWFVPPDRCLYFTVVNGRAFPLLELQWRDHVLGKFDTIPFLAADRFWGLVNTSQWDISNCLIESETDSCGETLRVRWQTDEHQSRVYTFDPDTLELRALEIWRRNELHEQYIVQKAPAESFPAAAAVQK